MYPPVIPEFSLADTNPLSSESHLKKSEPFEFAILLAARSMWVCVRLGSSNSKHSISPQSYHWVTAGRGPDSVILGFVRTDSFAMNPLKISLKLITPSVCNSVTSLMNGFMYFPR